MEEDEPTIEDDKMKDTKMVNIAELRGGRSNSAYTCAEVFSPPRLCDRARERGMKGGWSLDLSAVDPITGEKWDLRSNSKKKKGTI